MADRNWPHPVLESGGVDYPNRAFQVAYKVSYVGGKYLIKAQMEVGSDSLLTEIASGSAAYALKIHCPTTAYRRVDTSRTNEIVVPVSGDDLLNGFYLHGFVIAMCSFELASGEFDEVFSGLSFAVTKGAVLAVGEEQEYDADKSPDTLRNISSMFRIIRSHNPEAKLVALDFEQERVMIEVPATDFDRYNAYKSQAPYKEGFVASLVFPSLVQALITLKNLGEGAGDTRWQKSLLRRLEDAGLEVPTEDDAFDVAQRLLDRPISMSLSAISKIEEVEES